MRMFQLFSKRSRGASDRTYLDWASAAPVADVAQRAFVSALGTFGNPSSPHEEGRAAKDQLEQARLDIARLAGVKQRTVIFTSGATEANNLAIRGRVERCRVEGTAYTDMHVLYLPTMHASVVQTLHELAKLGVQTERIALSSTAIDLVCLKSQIRPQTVLICVDAVCGETGVRFDTLRVRRIIDELQHTDARAKRALLHVDASQLPLVESIDHTRLGADSMAMDAQKVGGIRGIGALILPNHRSIAPVIQGGGQEQGLRPGTEPVALASAFAAAFTECTEQHESFAFNAREARVELIKRISSTIPNIVLNENPRQSRQAPHILNISLHGIDTDYLVTLLDTAGFAVSTKSACETDSEDGSRAVLAYTSDQFRAASTLRISWGPQTKRGELERFASALYDAVTFITQP